MTIVEGTSVAQKWSESTCMYSLSIRNHFLSTIPPSETEWEEKCLVVAASVLEPAARPIADPGACRTVPGV